MKYYISQFLIFACVVLFNSVAHSQSTGYHYCDNILNQDSISELEFEQLDSALFLINYYLSDTAAVLYKNSIAKAIEFGLPKHAAMLELRLGDLHYELSDEKLLKTHVLHASEVLKEIDELWYARSANMRRLIATEENDFLEAYRVSYEALEIFERYDDERGMAIANRDIGSIKIQEGKYDEALEYCLKSIDGLLKDSDWYELGFSYQRLAIIHRNIGSFDKAQNYVQKAIDVSRRLGGFRSAQALSKKIWTRGYIYEGAEDYDNAILHYDSAKYYADKVNYHFIDKFIDSYKGGIFLKKKEYSLALSEFYSVLNIMERENRFVDEDDFYLPVYSNLVEAHEGLGQFKKANDLLKRIDATKDSLYILETAQQISELQTKYETKKKDEAIVTQEKELAQNDRIQILGGGVLLLLTTLLASLLWIYKKNKKFTEALSIKNTENEFLVKEIHHRVKNNLQILSSLLSLQSNYLKDEAASDAIREGRNRVESMGMIHQRLYSGEAKTAVDVKDYVDDLCEHLSESFLLEQQNVEISADIQVRQADVETAIPLGLIINELVTNSIKYAFDGRDSGVIKINIWENQLEQLCLEVKDDGLGDASVSAFKERSTNFGSDLVTVLMKKLKGTLEQTTDEGYTTTITFNRYKLVA